MLLEVHHLGNIETYEVKEGDRVDINIKDVSPNVSVRGPWCGLDTKRMKDNLKIFGNLSPDIGCPEPIRFYVA